MSLKSLESRGRRHGTVVTRLLQEACDVTIRGNLNRGVRPYINFEYVRYDSSLPTVCADELVSSCVCTSILISLNSKEITSIYWCSNSTAVNCAFLDSMSEASSKHCRVD